MENGIIHRDLKPANIFAHEGALKIGDFGLSRFIRSQQQLLRSFLGSNGYMSPQISNNSPDTPYSAKCDVWSFGVIVFEVTSHVNVDADGQATRTMHFGGVLANKSIVLRSHC